MILSRSYYYAKLDSVISDVTKFKKRSKDITDASKCKGFFPTKDIQTPTPSDFRSGNICIKGAYNAESNEKSIFHFSVMADGIYNLR